MLKATASAADRVRSASFMSEFSREILSGELIVLSNWTRELYLRRAAGRRKSAGHLVAEMREEPEEQGKCCAEEEAGDYREIKGGVFAAMDDVAGESSEVKREFAAEIEKSADGG
jgi:hypothetical protein